MSRFNILSLSGGGYRGIYTLCVLEYLEKMKGKPIGGSCDLITGTSVGGIIALALAAEIPVIDIKNFFEENKSKIFYCGFRNAFKNNTLSWIPNIFCAKYSANPLKECLTEFFENCHNIKVIGDLKHRVVITSVNYEHRSSQYFKTAHHDRFKWDYELSVVNVALATSAAPTYFAPHNICFKNGQTGLFIDGALSNNAPSFIGYHEAVNILNVKPENIYLMNIDTANDRVKLYQRKCSWGLCAWRKNGIFLTMNSQEKSAEYMTRHALRDNYLHVDSLTKDGLKVDNQYKAEFLIKEATEEFELDDISEKTTNKLSEYANLTFDNIYNQNGEWLGKFLDYDVSPFTPIYGDKI